MATNNGINLKGPTPLFNVYLNASATNVTGDGTDYTIPYDTVTTNITGSYDTGTHQFTSPLSGTYSFSATTLADGVYANDHLLGRIAVVQKTGASITGGAIPIYANPYNCASEGNTWGTTFTCLLYVPVGDTITVHLTIGDAMTTKVIGVLANYTRFSGFLVNTI